MNIADGEIGMQRLFISERLRRIVASLELHFQRGAYCRAKTQVEIAVAQPASGVVRRKCERDLHSSVVVQLCSLERPFHCAGEPMGRVGFAIAARAEPRENDWHAATYRLAGLEQTLGTDKKDR